jgi:hypothetical protein
MHTYLSICELFIVSLGLNHKHLQCLSQSSTGILSCSVSPLFKNVLITNRAKFAINGPKIQYVFKQYSATYILSYVIRRQIQPVEKLRDFK